ncbi:MULTISPECIES: hypothetical protein [Moorena]|uniref:Uncharacterized protein n=1 Tax=Moorena producens 3L TaxID=489825 RepID=F4XRK6_9CYAN|nr:MULTISPECIES: hypothetical protein [Moorena]EGJ32761.1 hypothetical protein LYNGBM3L_02040 [Moorena producens 3L]NEP66915.1 hypothetical protein [Moorena sp. SIO3A5]
MQRGLGGFPHSLLHQDTDALYLSAAHKNAIAFLRTGMRTLFEKQYAIAILRTGMRTLF